MNLEPIADFVKHEPKQSYFEEEAAEGPEGLRDYRPHRVDDHHAIGVGDVSSERSLDSGYLLRPAPGATLERPRSCHPGEVGWGIPWLVDWAPPKTGQQIMIGDFRQIAEDRATSQYLGAWYPGPKESTPQGSDGYYRENVYSESESALPTFSSESKDPSQGVCENPEVRMPEARIRPAEATQHNGIYRNC